MAFKINKRNDDGSYEATCKAIDVPNLPKKAVKQGSTVFVVDLSEVYMFCENEDPRLEGEWVSI